MKIKGTASPTALRILSDGNLHTEAKSTGVPASKRKEKKSGKFMRNMNEIDLLPKA